MGVKPWEVIVIGDDEYVDVALPKKLGMKTIQVVRKPLSKKGLADAYVDNLMDAVEIIREWSSTHV